MKKYILLLSACLLFISSASFALENSNDEDTQISKDKRETYFYYYKGEKKALELNPNYIFVSGTDVNSIQRANLGTLISVKSIPNVQQDQTSQQLLKPNNFVEKNPVKYWAEIELSQKYSQEEYLEKIEELKSSTNLTVAPYFDCGEGEAFGVSNYFYVKLKTPDDFNALLKQAAVHKVELVGYNKFMPLWFTLSTTPQSQDAVKTANLFYETGLFQYASPSFIVDIEFDGAAYQNGMELTPDDPYYPSQWHLNNTGQDGGVAGIDIKAEGAWDITLGDGINIAIVDSGFEADHPDLADNNVGDGYDTDTGTSPTAVWGRHGTACAGIAAAKGNNDTGVTGVAPNSGLISVSQSFNNGLNSISQMADGISWAWQNGADVISNSWNTNVSSCGILQCELVEDAINNALLNGRNGLGSVVVFSSGNDNINGANFPSNSNPLILCVGAIDKCGIRSGRTDIVPESCDPWCTGCKPGSSYGTPLDVVAGGTNVLTTDRVGGQGYNPPESGTGHPDTDYAFFGGTSAACPMVAGVTALVLSANPDLTVQQVNDIIEQSAQKIRQDVYTYSSTGGRPNGDWNNELGYGLVDAHQAVLLAQSLIPDCQPNIVHTGTINSGLYEAIYTVNSTATIGDNQDVTYHAGEHILLESVFVADAGNGSLFLAEISDCSSNLTNPTNNMVQQTEDVFYDYAEAGTTSSISLVENTSITTDALAINNYPDPFTGQTTIAFDLPEDTEVTLFISDVTGKQIALLSNKQNLLKGGHQITFDGNPYPAGIYYYTIQAGNHIETKKMILMK